MPHFAPHSPFATAHALSVLGSIRVCLSLYLNKSTTYLSFCLSPNSFFFFFLPNSFCDETSRTRASLGPETRYRGFWLGLSPSHVGLGRFGWVRAPAHGFKFQSVVNGFSSTNLHPHQQCGRVPFLYTLSSTYL